MAQKKAAAPKRKKKKELECAGSGCEDTVIWRWIEMEDETLYCEEHFWDAVQSIIDQESPSLTLEFTERDTDDLRNCTVN